MSEQQERDELARIAGEALLKLATVEAERDAALKEVERLIRTFDPGGIMESQEAQIAALTARLEAAEAIEKAARRLISAHDTVPFNYHVYASARDAIRAALTPPAKETKE